MKNMRKKTARWIKKTHIFRKDDYMCSACRGLFVRATGICPGCGAKMKGSKYDPTWVDEMEILSAIFED